MSRGGAREKSGRWYAHTRFGEGERLEFRVPWARAEAEALERARLMGDIAEALVSIGRRDLVRATLRQVAEANTEKRLVTVRKAVQSIVDGAIKAGHARDITLKQWGERYTSGELSRLWPDHVKEKDWDDDRSRLDRYVYPHVGGVPVVSFSFDHASLVLSKLPVDRVRRDATRRHVAQIMGRLMHVAVFPGRLIVATPLPRGWLPKIKDRRHYSCLYPREEALLLAHEASSAAFRLFCGILNREGMRLSELFDSAWKQWNLVEGTFTTAKTKTDDPRMWAIRPDVAEALRLWRDHVGTDARPFAPLDQELTDRTKIAEAFRDAIKAAGVDRAELFETTEHTGQLRAHDMRATFVTLALAEGKPDTWIRDRTAHKSTSMIDRYRRAARQFAELSVGSLPDLVEALGWRKGGGTAVVFGGPKGGLSARSTEGRTRTGTPLRTADFESDHRYPQDEKPQQFPVEQDVPLRSGSGFHRSSTTLTAPNGDGGGGPGGDEELQRTTGLRPGLARGPSTPAVRAGAGATGARLETADGRVLARVDVSPGDTDEDVLDRMVASSRAGGRSR